MLILSSPLTPSLLSPATIAGAAALTAPSQGAPTTTRPTPPAEESSDANSGDDERPAGQPGSTGRPGRSLAALDLQTQNAAQNTQLSQESDASSVESASVENGTGADDTTASDSNDAAADGPENEDGEKVDASGLTEEERREVEKLKQRDREVKEHEQAHASAGGGIAGQPSFKFTTGPDGRQYAVAGEVQIDTSPIRGNPAATIRKLEQVKRAALAPTNPSAQDRRVAASADASIASARQELTEQTRLELEQNDNSSAQTQSSSSNRSPRNAPDSNPEFDSGGRFQNVFKGVSELPGTGLPGAGALKTNVGLSDPGQLFDLIA